ATYALPFADDVIVDDATQHSGMLAMTAAADQRRLPGGDLVASGGLWCGPAEVVWTIADISCPDALWTAPSVQLTRGAITYFPTPTLDVGALTWVWTNEDDIEAADGDDPRKPCFHIPCPD